MIMMASDCPGLRSRSQACRLLYPARRIPLTWSPSPRIRRRSSVGLGQETVSRPVGSGLVWFNFGLTLAGWVLATAVAAGLSGVLKRSQ